VFSTTFLSGTVDVSARAAESAFAIKDRYRVKSIEVKDVKNPIRIQIPLKQDLTDDSDPTCVYFNTTTTQWTPVESQCEEGDEAPAGHFMCCTTHLTTFAVQELGSGSFFAAKTPIFYLALVNVLFLLLAIIGFFLDKKKKLIYTPESKDKSSPGGNVEMK